MEYGFNGLRIHEGPGNCYVTYYLLKNLIPIMKLFEPCIFVHVAKHDYYIKIHMVNFINLGIITYNTQRNAINSSYIGWNILDPYLCFHNFKGL
jgi:hypothetical protein